MVANHLVVICGHNFEAVVVRIVGVVTSLDHRLIKTGTIATICDPGAHYIPVRLTRSSRLTIESIDSKIVSILDEISIHGVGMRTPALTLDTFLLDLIDEIEFDL